jgi:hypothetical protein
MSIRTFEGESWICGWFNRHTGSLVDVQQYSTEEGAKQCAETFRGIYQTFVGRIEDVTDWESASKCDEAEMEPIDKYNESTVKSIVDDMRYEYAQYLQILIEAQKAGHDCHAEMNETIKALHGLIFAKTA